MTRKSIALALFASTLSMAAISAPANAASLDVSKTADNSFQASFWTDSLTFSLPTNAINIVMNISEAGADDKFVVLLNGTEVFAAGIYGPGTGTFQYTAGGANETKVFNYGDGPQNVDITSGFVAGVNTLDFIINDTYVGIGGELTNGPNGPAGPTSYNFVSTVSYDLRGTSAVPEPATWAMMLAGFGVAGAMIRRRGSVVAARVKLSA